MKVRTLIAVTTALSLAALALGLRVSVPNIENTQTVLFRQFDELERLGAYVVGEEGEMLGRISRGFGSDALGNEFGAGSEFRSNGLFNSFGKYGSSVSRTSAFSPTASAPPEILIKSGGDTYSVGVLTTNRFARTSGQRINPHLLRAWLKSK